MCDNNKCVTAFQIHLQFRATFDIKICCSNFWDSAQISISNSWGSGKNFPFVWKCSRKQNPRLAWTCFSFSKFWNKWTHSFIPQQCNCGRWVWTCTGQGWRREAIHFRVSARNISRFVPSVWQLQQSKFDCCVQPGHRYYRASCVFSVLDKSFLYGLICDRPHTGKPWGFLACWLSHLSE